MESDDALVRALEGGDAAAWDALLPRLGPPLLRYLADLTGDARLAEELARDAVLRVHAARAGGDASPLAPAAQLAVAATQLWRERQPEGAGEARARAALWLVAGFGLGEREIGTALGVAPAAAAEWVARARRDPAAGEALRALPLPALPVSLARGVQLGIARAARTRPAARRGAPPSVSLSLPRARRAPRLLLAAALVALAVGLAWQLVERIPRAPEAGVSESQPPPEAERALEPPPALAEEPAPEEPPAEAAPLGDVPADAPTLEDLAVIELLHVLHELGDVGGAPR